MEPFDAPFARLRARVEAAGGPLDALDDLIHALRPFSGTAMRTDRLEALRAAADAEDVRAGLVTLLGQRRTGVGDRVSMPRLGAWAGFVRPVADDVAAIRHSDDPVPLARELWLRCWREGADEPEPVAGLADHPVPEVALFASCAARHLVCQRGTGRPPALRGGGRPVLDGRFAEYPWQIVTVGWDPPESPRVGRGGHPLRCALCAADGTEVVHHVDDSGTGWRCFETVVRCPTCAAFTRMDVDD
ncbi:MAG: hypothetical protein KC656_05580 [Myxococcales bacterium]|nr:hypothetical protein [Myxococcales bacterium]